MKTDKVTILTQEDSGRKCHGVIDGLRIRGELYFHIHNGAWYLLNDKIGMTISRFYQGFRKVTCHKKAYWISSDISKLNLEYLNSNNYIPFL